MDVVERLTNKPEPCRRYSAEDDALRSEAAATITALRARVEALEGALARADRLIDALWTDQIVPDEHGGTRSAIRAALRAKGGE